MTFPSAISRGALLLILTATVAQAPPPPPSTPSPDELQFGRALAGEDYSFSFAYEAVADPSPSPTRTAAPTRAPTATRAPTPAPTATRAPTSETTIQLLITNEVRGAVFPVNRWGTMCTAAALNATPCDCYGGASRRAAKIAELRARAPNRTAVVDMGGFFFGSGLAYPTFGGNASARYFAATGYDAYGLHWRDLTPSATDAGASLARYVDRLRALDPGLPPAVTTNLNLSGTALGAAHVRPWTLVDVGGARVAFLSLMDPATSLWSYWEERVDFVDVGALPSTGRAFERAIDGALAALYRLPDGEAPDAVVVLARTDLAELGDGGSGVIRNELWEILARKIVGLAAVVYMESVDDELTGRWAPALLRTFSGDHVYAAPAAAALGVEVMQVELTLRRDRPLFAGATAHATTYHYLDCAVNESAATLAELMGYYDAMEARLDVTTGYTAAAVDGERDYAWDAAPPPGLDATCDNPSFIADEDVDGAPLRRAMCGCRLVECAAGNLVADAMRHYAGADVALANSGAIRETIPSGAVTYAEILLALPFLNQLVKIERVSGAVLRRALENSISKLVDDAASVSHGKFAQVSGLSFTWSYCGGVPTVLEAKVGGAPLEAGRAYSVAVNSFLAGGGDGYDDFAGMSVVDIGFPVSTSVAYYLEEMAPTAAAALDVAVEGRIVQADVTADLASGNCDPCPAGSYAAADNETATCAKCPAGKHAEFPGATYCEVCGARAYAAARGAVLCDACPAHTARATFEDDPLTGLPVVVLGTDVGQCECEPGFFVLDGASGAACEPCPHGAVCRGKQTLPYPQPGHWADVASPAWLHDMPACVYGANCPGAVALGVDHCFASIGRLEACKNGSALAAPGGARRRLAAPARRPSFSLCETGAGGRLCAVCAERFYDDGARCARCEGSYVGLVLLLAFLALLGAGAVGVCVAYGRRLKRLAPRLFEICFDSGRAKIVWATMQIVGSIEWATGVEWPQPFRTLARWFAVTRLTIADVLPTSCAVHEYDYYDHVLVSTLVPLALCFLAWSRKWVAAVARARCRCSSLSGSSLLAFDAAAMDATRFTLVLAYLVLPTTSMTLFRVFLCTEFADGTAWLDADYSLRCDSREHESMKVFCGIMIAVFPVGIPALFAVLLFREREAISARDPDKKPPYRTRHISFLFASYRPDKYNAEIRECVRRLLLSSLLVFVGRTSTARAAWGVALAWVSALAFREYTPFASPVTNALAVAAEWQVVFTFLMAALLVSRPFHLRAAALSYALVVANVAILAVALVQQLRVARYELKMRELQRRLQLRMLNVVAVRRGLGVRERRRFISDDWAATPRRMSRAQLDHAANAAQLDVVGVKNDDEMRRFLAYADASDRHGKKAVWYWKEDKDRIGRHKKEEVDGEWAKYADSVAAQLEFFHAKLAKGEDGAATLVEVDVAGRVTSIEGRGSLSGNGTAYTVDLSAMEQTNASSGYKRAVRRKEIAVDAAGAAGLHLALDDDNDDGDDDDDDAAAAYADVPPFPYDLNQREEPVLLIRKGYLVQVTRKREDGWWYGFVVFGADAAGATENADDDADGQIALTAILPKRSPPPPGVDAGGVDLDVLEAPAPAPVLGAGEAKTEAEAEQLGLSGRDDADEHDRGAGWFPSQFVRDARTHEFREMLKALGYEGAVDALAPPATWSPDPDPSRARMVELGAGSTERAAVEAAFRATCSRRVTAVRRVENLVLWQSYAAKRQTMLERARREGVGASNYERVNLFHGSSADVIPNICQQGFNRSFAGKNAVAFGRGVYFATTASYSANYCSADGGGKCYMFVCRVMVGEYTLGSNGLTVPAVRNWDTRQLYDTTTDSTMSPSMFITYHDAQAYPEYMVEFN